MDCLCTEPFLDERHRSLTFSPHRFDRLTEDVVVPCAGSPTASFSDVGNEHTAQPVEIVELREREAHRSLLVIRSSEFVLLRVPDVLRIAVDLFEAFTGKGLRRVDRERFFPIKHVPEHGNEQIDQQDVDEYHMGCQ